MISANIRKITEEIPAGVNLIAVSKTKPAEMIQEAYDAGQRAFGENKVQEMVAKHSQLPEDIEWHLIGHLQSNKVKYIASFVHLIHSVDSLKLLEVINKEAAKSKRTIRCLLQFHIASEETKFGLDIDEALALLSSDSYRQMQHVVVCGVMGMASFTEDEQLIRKEFRTLRSYFTLLREGVMAGASEFKIISCGMSGDYRIAIDEGSTMIRVGGAIFGTR
jgi:pyridoxal phosphate enzyme (YggS family)